MKNKLIFQEKDLTMKNVAAVVGLFVGAGIYYYATGDGLITAMVEGKRI